MSQKHFSLDKELQQKEEEEMLSAEELLKMKGVELLELFEIWCGNAAYDRALGDSADKLVSDHNVEVLRSALTPYVSRPLS